LARINLEEENMLNHVHSTTIYVKDQDKAIAFYTNVLGLEKVIDAQMGPDMRFVTVVPPGAQTQIVLGAESWGDRAAGGQTGITFTTNDIDATYKELTAKGVRFKAAPEAMPWGDKAAWFYDPCDNEFFLNEDKNAGS